MITHNTCEDTVKAMQATIDQLTARIAELEAMQPQEALPIHNHLTATERRLFSMLHANINNTVRSIDLMPLMKTPSHNNLEVNIHRIKRKLADHMPSLMVFAARDVGYRMEEV